MQLLFQKYLGLLHLTDPCYKHLSSLVGMPPIQAYLMIVICRESEATEF